MSFFLQPFEPIRRIAIEVRVYRCTNHRLRKPVNNLTMTHDLVVQYATDKSPLVLSTRDVLSFEDEVVKYFYRFQCRDVLHFRIFYGLHEEEQNPLSYNVR